MQAVVLAGGISKRFRPLCSGRPKPMYSLMGKPVLHYTLSTLKDAGVSDVAIVEGYLGDQLRNYFRKGEDYGLRISYAHQENSLGMADALKAASSLLDEHFILINGSDVIESEAIRLVVGEFRRRGAEMVLCSREVREPEKFGTLDFDENGKVKRIVEKPKKGTEPSQYAVVSPYLIPRSLTREIDALPISDTQFEDAIQLFINKGNEVRATTYEGSFSTLKYPWDLLEVSRHLMSKHIKKTVVLSSKVSEISSIEGPVIIEEDAKVVPSASIVGPCFIGRGVFVGHNALLRDYACIDSGSVVGYSTEVKNSVVGKNCLFHSNYVGDSIIEDGCSLGAGAITANLRFDGKTVKVNIGGKLVDSSLTKLGVIMGENSKVGVNANLMPGVKVGPNAIVGPGVVLYRDILPSKSIFVDTGKTQTVS